MKYIFQGRTQGGGLGGSGEPPFFQINYIHGMAWHACLVCKIVTAIQDTYLKLFSLRFPQNIRSI